MTNPTIKSDRTLFASARALAAVGLGAIGTLAGSAQATWSILIADTRTGEIVIGSATCVELIDLQRNTPVLITGVGAVTAQSVVDTSGSNRQLIRDRLLQGVPLGAILDELAATDSGHNNRQYGFITAAGEQLTFSGPQNADWAGGITGRIERGLPGLTDDIVYSVQGNILAGGNVVQSAVDALLGSDGDLPQMMMEAMQAAKSAGGDGRCSCSQADPTGCGSPPPEPFKSAHVGYMLGTRAGDFSSARAIYPTDGLIGGVGLIDLDGDGFDDVVIGNADDDGLTLFANSAAPGDPLSHLMRGETILAPSSDTFAMETGDFDNDGQPELGVLQTNPPQLTIYEADGNGGLGDPVSLDLPGMPASITSGALTATGDTIAIGFADTQQVVFYGQDKGAFGQVGALALDFAPAGLAFGELVAGGGADLAVADFGGDRAVVFEHDGALGFTLHSAIPTMNEPLNLRSADMDLDGENELLVQTVAARRVQIFALDAGVWSEWGSVGTNRVGLAFNVAPMNPGDDYPDIVTTSNFGGRNLQLQISDGQGGFTQQSIVRGGEGVRSVLLRDMNANGNLDIVIGNGGIEGLMILDNPGDGNLPQPGQFAAGDFFMSFNVRNQRDDDPDPVDQLQQMYNDWLLTRDGRVDAVESVLSGRRRVELGQSTTLSLELRDLNGALLPISDPAQIQVLDADLVSPLAVINTDPGVFSLRLSAGDAIGLDRVRVRVGDPGDPSDQVELMPALELFVVEDLADLNADGVCTFPDVPRFISLFVGQSPDADFDGNGSIDILDVSAFIDAFNACRGG